MASAYCVYVHALHFAQLFFQVLLGHSAAMLKAVLMPVYAVQYQALAVHIQHAALNAYVLEAHLNALKIAFIAVRGDKGRG